MLGVVEAGCWKTVNQTTTRQTETEHWALRLNTDIVIWNLIFGIFMLLRVLKTNQAYHFILIPLMAALLWLPSLIRPETYLFYSGEDMMPLYRPVAWLMAQSKFLNSIVPLIMLVLLSFLAIRLNIQYAFIRIRTFLPASLLIFITSGLISLHAMHPVYFAVFFLLFAIDRIFDSYEKNKIHSNAFDASLLISIGSLFYLNLIFFFPVVWIGLLIIHKQIKWRDFILPLVGLILPWIFTFTVYFFSNRLLDFLIILEKNIFSSNNFLAGNISLQVYLGLLVLITLLGSFFLLSQYDEKKISSRKFFQVFFFVFLISLVLIVVIPAVSQEIFIILAIPLSFLIANYLVFMKRGFWGELILYLLLAGVIYLQFV